MSKDLEKPRDALETNVAIAGLLCVLLYAFVQVAWVAFVGFGIIGVAAVINIWRRVTGNYE